MGVFSLLFFHEFLPVWSNRSVCAVAVKWFQTDFEISQLVLRYSNNKVQLTEAGLLPAGTERVGKEEKKNGA